MDLKKISFSEGLSRNSGTPSENLQPYNKTRFEHKKYNRKKFENGKLNCKKVRTKLYNLLSNT